MRILNRLLAVLAFFSLTVLFACQAPAGAPAVVAPDPGAGSGSGSGATAVEPAPTEQIAQAEVVSTDRYPALLLALLNDAERARLVQVAEAELCPCEGQVTSLDQCLRTLETSCMLSVQVGALSMRMIKEGADDREINAQIQLMITNARRVVEFDLTGVPWKGAENPTITLVEFADFQCPACRQFAESLRAAVAAFPEQVRLYYRHFPLPSHPNAALAAVAANAAGRQGRFWEYHDLVFENQAELHGTTDPAAILVGFAEQLGMNTQRFREDMNDPALLAAVEADRAAGMEAGLEGTPTLYINGVRLLDGYDTAALLANLQQRLGQ